MSRPLRIASVNVNGIRAAVRKGMHDWLEQADVDVLTLQEVRAGAADLQAALPGWHVHGDEALAKGRAGVAIATRAPLPDPVVTLGGDDFDSYGRWIEVELDIDGQRLRVISAYVYTGEDGTEKQVAKYAFLDAMQARIAELDGLAVVTGDLNVCHREQDLRNWKGNLKKAGFLRPERAYFDRILGAAGSPVECIDGTVGTGLGWVDIGRRLAGDVDGPYTWWSNRGKAFDTDTGWRIDYQLASPALAERAVGYRVDRASAWDTRWSDHAPVVADYDLRA